MRERVLKMGEPAPLVGVATEPEGGSGRLALLVLNSGLMHHVGTCRLSVKLARAAAQRGILAVRFDFSGIGDSPTRRTVETFDDLWREECVEVMNHLQKSRGIDSFILFGLCSGADVAYHTAVQDERVIGYAQVDGYCYRTPRYFVERYPRMLLNLKRWRRFLKRQWRFAMAVLRRVDLNEGRLRDAPRTYPQRDRVAAALRTLVARGVRMHLIFTGGEKRYSYRGQYRDSFRDVDFGPLLEVDYYPASNHIITDAEYQRRVLARLSSWFGDIAARVAPVPHSKAV